MEGATWAAFAMAALSLVGNVFSAVNARKAARDKLDFDLKTRELELRQGELSGQLAQVKSELAHCQEQHRDSQDQHRASEAAREQLRAEVSDLRERMGTEEARGQKGK